MKRLLDSTQQVVRQRLAPSAASALHAGGHLKDPRLKMTFLYGELFHQLPRFADLASLTLLVRNYAS